MEPGHEDREYARVQAGQVDTVRLPQWSPVMKTGNTPLMVDLGGREGGLNGARS